MPTSPSSSTARLPRRARRRWDDGCAAPRRSGCPTVSTGIERRHRLLEDHRDAARRGAGASRAPAAAAGRVPSNSTRPRGDPARRRHEPHQRRAPSCSSRSRTRRRGRAPARARPRTTRRRRRARARRRAGTRVRRSAHLEQRHQLGARRAPRAAARAAPAAAAKSGRVDRRVRLDRVVARAGGSRPPSATRRRACAGSRPGSRRTSTWIGAAPSRRSSARAICERVGREPERCTPPASGTVSTYSSLVAIRASARPIGVARGRHAEQDVDERRATASGAPRRRARFAGLARPS